MDGFFPLKTAKDLREKLCRDLKKIRDNDLDPDVYFNFYVTAEALLDWVFPGIANNQVRNALRGRAIELQICSHLASGAKHLKVEHKRHESVIDTGMARPGVLDRSPEGTFPDGMFPDFMAVYLEGKAADELGEVYPAQGLAYRIYSFWERYPLDPSEEDDPLFNSDWEFRRVAGRG